MVLHYFLQKENKEKELADNIYINVVNLSKNFLNNNNFFYKKNYNSSFEIISLIIIMYVFCLINYKKNNYKIINQYLIDNFIQDIDKSLRENGIGDMSIGKYVKTYVKKFYYRLKKMDNILKKFDNNNMMIFIDELDYIEKSKLDVAAEKIKIIYEEIKEIIKKDIKY